ncbi:hypothetical protein BH23BAC2_BH23BAC2_03500 [soil metagenome]
MEIKISYRYIVVFFIALSLWGCKVPQGNARKENKSVPERFYNAQDSANAVQLNWRAYFSDVALIALIDTALKNNQELNITRQEIEISKNEIRARKGEYLPFVGIAGSLGLEKEGRFTRQGAVEESFTNQTGYCVSSSLIRLYVWSIRIMGGGCMEKITQC